MRVTGVGRWFDPLQPVTYRSSVQPLHSTPGCRSGCLHTLAQRDLEAISPGQAWLLIRAAAPSQPLLQKSTIQRFSEAVHQRLTRNDPGKWAAGWHGQRWLERKDPLR